MNTNVWRGGANCLAFLLTIAASHISVAADITAADQEAICRVLYAEAAGQPIAGKVGVVEVILTRMRVSGSTAEQVVNARGQFEPVIRAGGSWRNLRPLTAAEQAECNAILQLKEGGWLTDIVPMATHFQNPKIVATRAETDTANQSLVDFGGMPIVATIGDHRFYKGGKPPKPKPRGMVSMFTTIDNTGEQETEIVNGGS